MNLIEQLSDKIRDRNAVIGILGLGYVGLPLAVAFAKAGFPVVGFEKSQKKVDALARGVNYIKDISESDFQGVAASGRLSPTMDFSRIKECDALIICVPTPLDEHQKPDMRFIEAAAVAIGQNLRPGVFVSLESTTYPTTTEDFLKPIVERESGLKENKDFWLAFSPERVDPGNPTYKTENTPKVLGALGIQAQSIGKELYESVIEHVHIVSTPRAAEMVKILENTYRLVNISLINELALLAGRMDIDIWEVIEAAKTKPFGFQAFYPGPGVGGHCIPLDPFYLSYIAKKYDFNTTLIETAGNINNQMPHKMMVKINFALNRQKKPLNGSKVLFLGVAYKPDIDDDRESPALRVMDEVAKKLATVTYHDPHIAEVVTPAGRHFENQPLTASLLEEADCVVITTNHRVFDADFIKEHARLIVDMRNAIKVPDEKTYRI